MPDPKLTLYFGQPHLSRVAADVSRQALDVPAPCTHLPAPYISALHPEVGSWCEGCGETYFRDLVAVEACLRCGIRPPLPVMLYLPTDDGHTVLARLCDPCCLGTAPQNSER